MRKILFIGLAALAAACGSSEEKQEPLRYGTPQTPSYGEQDAAATAAATFQSSLAYQASTEPTAGAAGLGDQMAASLGAYAAPAKMPRAWSAKAAGSVLRQAFDTGGMDPACVHTGEAGGVTTVTWSGCVIEAAETDPYTGESMTMRAEIDGSLTWTPATGRTAWNIGWRMWMTMISADGRMDMSEAAGLTGSTTITASTILASTVSVADATVDYMGMHVSETLTTTLEADLDYQADPFCITGGTLRVEQRPGGAMGTVPEGWLFEWSGCGVFTVAQGS